MKSHRTIFLYLIISLFILTSCAQKQKQEENTNENMDSITSVDTVADVSTTTDEDIEENSSSSTQQDNSWLIGKWAVQTDYGVVSLLIIDSENAISQGDPGKYTVEDGEIYFRDRSGTIVYPLDYTNHTIDAGSGYIMHKVNSSYSQSTGDNNNSDNNSSTNNTEFYSEADVLQYLASHIFKSNGGDRIRYNMSELDIQSSRNTLTFINVEVQSYSSDYAVVSAISTQFANVSITLRINASNSTIRDSDGTTYYTR